MSLKSIRESYQNLLTAFNDAGIKFTESQKSAIDTFVMDLETTMSNQRRDTIRKTARVVEAKLERQYKMVFESILTNMGKNAELASKIQHASTALNEQKKIADKVDQYLDLYVESVLPKKTIVDYDRMQKLERIHENLRESLALSEDTVQTAEKKLRESYETKKSQCETKVAEMTVALDEAKEKMAEMQKKIDKVNGAELLEKKTKDLPEFEATRIKKQLKGKTDKEVAQKFDKTLKEIQKATAKKKEEADLTLEKEIKGIVDGGVDENDMLRDGTTPHNGKGKHNGDVPPAGDTSFSEEEQIDENFETMEQIHYTPEGDISLDESEVIDSNLMKLWCQQSIEVK